MVARQMSKSRWLLVVASLCAVFGALAADTQKALITFTAGSIPKPYATATRMMTPAPRSFSEFIVEADGSVVGFDSSELGPRSVYRWRAGKWSQDDTMRPEVPIYDAVQAPDGKWFLAGSRSQDKAILYKYDDSILSQVATVAGNSMSGRLTLHLAPDGTVWIASKGQTVYGVKDGKTMTHELFPGISPASSSNYPLPVSLQAPGRGLWFWSPAGYSESRISPALAVNGSRFYENGQWRTMPGISAQLGGAAPIDSNTILCAPRSGGMFSLSLADGSIKDVPWTLPENESCVFLHNTPSHHMLAITAKPNALPLLARNSDGAMGKLVVFENGRAKTLLDGIDAIGTTPSLVDKSRAVVDTPKGTFIATAGRGIVFVSSDASQARRFDWRFNIPTSNVVRMRVRNNLLYLLDANTGLAIVDWTKLLNMPEPSPDKDPWNEYTTSAQPAAGPDGAIWWLDRNKQPGQLNCWRDGKLTSVALAGGRFDTFNIRSVAADSKGGVWLLYDSASVRTPRFMNGEWRVFDNGEIAWSSLALEEKDNPSFKFAGSGIACPVFGGNGRVAYRDLMKGARYFDGASWQTIPQPSGMPVSGLLSFENGVLTMSGSNGYSQFIDGKWQPRPAPDRTQPVSADAIAAPPESFPGDKGTCRIFLSDRANTLWAGNPEELYRGVDDFWVRFPTIGTPLFASVYITQVLIDGSGDLWFVMSNGPSPQLAHYHDGANAPTIEWQKPPPAVTTANRAVFYCKVPQIKERQAVLRYRVDEGPWRQIATAARNQEIVLENLPNGKHKIEARAYDDLLRSSRLLTSVFEVQRDYGAEIKDLIPQLKDPKKREAAVRELAAIGRPAAPALTEQMINADSQLQWWIRAILDEISRNEKEKGK